jgi:hypothetical protein
MNVCVVSHCTELYQNPSLYAKIGPKKVTRVPKGPPSPSTALKHPPSPGQPLPRSPTSRTHISIRLSLNLVNHPKTTLSYTFLHVPIFEVGYGGIVVQVDGRASDGCTRSDCGWAVHGGKGCLECVAMCALSGGWWVMSSFCCYDIKEEGLGRRLI